MVASTDAKNYYAILGVPPDAAPEDIKSAYRRCVHIYHPDRFQDASGELRAEAERRMKELNEAYEALSDPHRRADYDRERRSDDEAGDPAAARPVVDPSILDAGRVEVDGQQRACASFRLDIIGGPASNVRLDPSHDWMTLHVNQIYDGAAFPMLVTVVVDTSALRAGVEYEAEVRVTVDRAETTVGVHLVAETRGHGVSTGRSASAAGRSLWPCSWVTGVWRVALLALGGLVSPAFLLAWADGHLSAIPQMAPADASRAVTTALILLSATAYSLATTGLWTNVEAGNFASRVATSVVVVAGMLGLAVALFWAAFAIVVVAVALFILALVLWLIAAVLGS